MKVYNEDGTLYRQGDIYLRRIDPDEVPTERRQYEERATEDGKAIVGLGEATGHCHVVQQAKFLATPETDLNEFANTGNTRDSVYLIIEEDTQITHQEHATIELPVGVYEVYRQQEYRGGSVANVAD